MAQPPLEDEYLKSSKTIKYFDSKYNKINCNISINTQNKIQLTNIIQTYTYIQKTQKWATNANNQQQSEMYTQHLLQVLKLTSINNEDRQFQKSQAQSIRFGDILRSKSNDTYVRNSYNFNLSIKQSFDSVNVKCAVVATYVDVMALRVPLLAGMDTVRVDFRNVPIVDCHDLGSDRQILHKFIVRDTNGIQSNYSIKAYQFQNYHDILFKSGIYQAYIYQTLNKFTGSTSFLQDIFIIEKGTPMSLVFVYNSYLYSLEDILFYRREANLPYTEKQQIYIAHQLLNRYLMLFRNNILHRDIRPSKIYLAQSSNPVFKGYEFQNLQSARRLVEREKINFVNNSPIVPMTARGVPAFSSNQVANFIMNGQQLGIYDPWHNDRVALAKTISMLVTLQFDSSTINYQTLKQKNQTIFDLVSKLQKSAQSLQQLQRELSSKNKQSSITIIDTDYHICLNYLPKLLRDLNKDRIEAATTEILFALDLQQQYTNRLDKMISQNYRNSAQIQNVSILDRLGRHYEGKGVMQNDYYVQQISLLLQLAQDRRLRGFPAGHFLQRANQIFMSKFNGRSNNEALNAEIKVQNAYSYLSTGNLQAAGNQINTAMMQASQSKKIPFNTQLKLIQAKGIIDSSLNGPDNGDILFQKGIELSSNRQNFITEVSMLDSKSTFQSLMGQNLLHRLKNNKSAMSAEQYRKQIAQCQMLLTQSRNTKLQIPLKNPLPIAHVHEALGDLSILREDFHGADDNYKKAFQFMNSTQGYISDTEKIRMLEKTHEYYQRYSDHYTDQQKIRNEIMLLKGNDRDKKVERSDRSYFKNIRYIREQKKKKSLDEQGYAIAQADELEQQDQSKRIHMQNNIQKSKMLPQTATK